MMVASGQPGIPALQAAAAPWPEFVFKAAGSSTHKRESQLVEFLLDPILQALQLTHEEMYDILERAIARVLVTGQLGKPGRRGVSHEKQMLGIIMAHCAPLCDNILEEMQHSQEFRIWASLGQSGLIPDIQFATPEDTLTDMLLKREEDKAAAPPDASAALDAPAGSGKSSIAYESPAHEWYAKLDEGAWLCKQHPETRRFIIEARNIPNLAAIVGDDVDAFITAYATDPKVKQAVLQQVGYMRIARSKWGGLTGGRRLWLFKLLAGTLQISHAFVWNAAGNRASPSITQAMLVGFIMELQEEPADMLPDEPKDSFGDRLQRELQLFNDSNDMDSDDSDDDAPPPGGSSGPHSNRGRGGRDLPPRGSKHGAAGAGGSKTRKRQAPLEGTSCQQLLHLADQGPVCIVRCTGHVAAEDKAAECTPLPLELRIGQEWRAATAVVDGVLLRLLPATHLRLLRILGTGLCGTVFLASVDGRLCAFKSADLHKCKEEVDSLFTERIAYGHALHLQGTFLPYYYGMGACHYGNAVYQTTQPLKGVHPASMQDFTSEEMTWWQMSATQGLQALHDANIAHGDVRSDNMISDRKARKVYYIDLGKACIQPTQKQKEQDWDDLRKVFQECSC